MAKKLTDLGIKRLTGPKTGRAEHWDAKVGGFGVRVTAGGVKSFQLMYRFKGKLRRVTLGRSPSATRGEDAELPADQPRGGYLTLAQARRKAEDIISLARAGKDPERAEADARAKHAQLDADTFAAVRARFVAEYCRPRLRTWAVAERYLTRDLADWDERPISTISKRDIIEAVERKARTGGIAANRLLAYISKLMRWCAAKDILQTVPVLGIERPGVETARERTLSETEIAKLWPCWQQQGWPSGPMFQILLATGQRRNQVASMRWRSIRPRPLPETMVEGCPCTPITWVWELGATEMKGKRGHVLPLSDIVMEILASLPRTTSDYIFPARRKGRSASEERGYASGFSKAKARSDEASGVIGWALHDLRRTAASGMASLGIAEAIVGRVLHHAPRTVTSRHYDMYGYLDEMKVALDAWAKKLGSIVGIATATDVVDFAAQRARRAARE